MGIPDIPVSGAGKQLRSCEDEDNKQKVQNDRGSKGFALAMRGSLIGKLNAQNVDFVFHASETLEACLLSATTLGKSRAKRAADGTSALPATFFPPEPKAMPYEA